MYVCATSSVCYLLSSCVVRLLLSVIFFFKQKTAYEMRISDWSSDVCSSDLRDKLASAIKQSVGKFFSSEVEVEEIVTDVEDAIYNIGDSEIGRASCRERVCQYV